MPSASDELPTPAELQAAWEHIQEIHKEYLAKHEVRLPKAKHYADEQKSLWLAVLHFYEEQEVDKNKVSEIAQRDLENAAADQQVRHLKRDGWDIGDKRGVHKLNPYRASAEWLNEAARQTTRLNASDFDGIKKAYGHKCATCGASEGKPDPRYGDTIVKLQQGHQDPHKPGDASNIIPQCEFCNRAYKDYFTFDNKGRVRAVASAEPVKRASRDVQLKIRDWLVTELKEQPPEG